MFGDDQPCPPSRQSWSAVFPGPVKNVSIGMFFPRGGSGSDLSSQDEKRRGRIRRRSRCANVAAEGRDIPDLDGAKAICGIGEGGKLVSDHVGFFNGSVVTRDPIRNVPLY